MANSKQDEWELPAIDGLDLDGDGNDAGHGDGDDNLYPPDDSEDGGHGDYEGGDDDDDDEAAVTPRSRLSRFKPLLMIGGAAVAFVGALQVPVIRNHIPFLAHHAAPSPQRPHVMVPQVASAPVPVSPQANIPSASAPQAQASQGQRPVSPTSMSDRAQDATMPTAPSFPAAGEGASDTMSPSTSPSGMGLTPPGIPAVSRGEAKLDGATSQDATHAGSGMSGVGEPVSGDVLSLLSSDMKVVREHVGKVEEKLDDQSGRLEAIDSKVTELAGAVQSLHDQQDIMAAKMDALAGSIQSSGLHHVHASHGAGSTMHHATHHKPSHHSAVVAPSHVSAASIDDYKLIGISRNAATLRGPHGYYRVAMGSAPHDDKGNVIEAVGTLQGRQYVDGKWEITTSKGIVRQAD